MKQYFLNSGIIDSIMLNRYLTFVESIRQNPPTNCYIEEHHILPKSLFPEYKKSEWNIIAMTARQHFISHIMLWKIFQNKQMSHALWAMNNQRSPKTKRDNKLGSRHYQMLKEEMSNRMKMNNPMHNPEVLKKKSGKHHHCYTKPLSHIPTKTKEQHEDQSTRMRLTNPMFDPAIAKKHGDKLRGIIREKTICPICGKIVSVGAGFSSHMRTSHP